MICTIKQSPPPDSDVRWGALFTNRQRITALGAAALVGAERSNMVIGSHPMQAVFVLALYKKGYRTSSPFPVWAWSAKGSAIMHDAQTNPPAVARGNE